MLRHSRVANSQGLLQRVHVTLRIPQFLDNSNAMWMRKNTQKLREFLSDQNTVGHRSWTFYYKIQTFESYDLSIFKYRNLTVKPGLREFVSLPAMAGLPQMHGTRIPIASFPRFSRDFVAANGDLAVEPLPEWERKRDVKQRREGVKPG